MMTEDVILNLFTYKDLLGGIKIASLLIEGLYFVFALIIVRQIGLMNRSFKTNYGFFFKLVAYLHFFATAGLIVLTVLLL